MKHNPVTRCLSLVLALMLMFCMVAVSEEQGTQKAAKAVTQYTLNGNASVTINVGDQMQVRLNGVEATAWKTSKAKVATVTDKGLVTAVAKGKAKITVTTSAKKKLKLTLTVVDPYEPSGVSFPQGKEITVNVGSTVKLTPALAPATARTTYTWKTGKAKIATVDGNGVVTGLKEGKAKITVRTANKKKATITVIVADPYKPSEVHFAEGEDITIGIGESVKLKPVLSPASARTTYTWKSSKKKIVEVDGDGVVYGAREGYAKITVTTANKKKAFIYVYVEEKPEPTPQPTPTPAPRYIGNLNSYVGKSYSYVSGRIADPLKPMPNQAGSYYNDYMVLSFNNDALSTIFLMKTTDRYKFSNIYPGMYVYEAAQTLSGRNWKKIGENSSISLWRAKVNGISCQLSLSKSGSKVKQILVTCG